MNRQGWSIILAKYVQKDPMRIIKIKIPWFIKWVSLIGMFFLDNQPILHGPNDHVTCMLIL